MEKELRKAMGADSLVLGASRPQFTTWFRKDAGRFVNGRKPRPSVQTRFRNGRAAVAE